MDFPWAPVIMGGATLLSSLFGGNSQKQSIEAQKALQEAAWRRQDQMKPFSTGLMNNPIMDQRMNTSMQNNAFDWGSMQGMMSPRMLALLNAAAPQYAPYQQQQDPPSSFPPPRGGGPGYFGRGGGTIGGRPMY